MSRELVIAEPALPADSQAETWNVLETLLDPSDEADARCDSGPRPLHGPLIGEVVGRDDMNRPLVRITELAAVLAVAHSTVPLVRLPNGAPVLLLFQQGDPNRPIIVGALEPGTPNEASTAANSDPAPWGTAIAATVDDERIVITAQREIVLQCGQASITLTRAGKVLLRGAYVSSRSSGVNRIKGGSVQIN